MMRPCAAKGKGTLGATTPTSSWQFFLEVREVLGVDALMRIFGNVSNSSIYRWGRKPSETTDWQAGPLVHLAELFRLLVEQGKPGLAEAGLRILAEPCGAQVQFRLPGSEPESLPGAVADVLEAATELQRALRSGADSKIVESLADVVHVRVDQLTQGTRSAQATGQRPRWSRGPAPARGHLSLWARLTHRA